MPTKFLAGLVTAGLLLSPLASAADQAQMKNRESNEMAQAIAFERQKDAAAARQARIEAKRPTVTYSGSEAERSADRDNSKTDNSTGKHPKEQHQRE